MTDNSQPGSIADDCLAEIIAVLRANLCALDNVGFDVAAAYLSLAIENLEAQRK